MVCTIVAPSTNNTIGTEEKITKLYMFCIQVCIKSKVLSDLPVVPEWEMFLLLSLGARLFSVMPSDKRIHGHV